MSNLFMVTATHRYSNIETPIYFLVQAEHDAQAWEKATAEICQSHSGGAPVEGNEDRAFQFEIWDGTEAIIEIDRIQRTTPDQFIESMMRGEE